MRDGLKTGIRWIMAYVLVVGGVLGIVWRLGSSAPAPLQRLDPSNPRHREMLCGPVSLSVALGRLGISSASADLASQCEVDSTGVTLRELARVAEGVPGVKSRARCLNWQELKRFDGTAVLFVTGDHFVAADPREALSDVGSNGAAMRVYDEGKPAQWMTRDALEKLWKGEALLIERRRPATPQAAGPRIEWDRCFLDNGVLTPNADCHYVFPFRNTGAGDLTVSGIKKSCGCATYSLTGERLAPGQAGVIEADINLNGQEGYFQNYLLVQTNDATNPLSLLRMAGGVPKTRVLSVDRISLGDLPQGGELTGEFYASDPGFNGLKILDISFVPTSGSGIAEHLSCSVTCDVLGDDVQRVARLVGYRGEPEDHVIRFTVEASAECPVGSFHGEVRIVTLADGVTSTHTATIAGAVVQDVHPVPGIALITLDDKGAGSATIELRSHSRQAFQIVETWASSVAPVEIKRADAAQGRGARFTLSISTPLVVAGTAPTESAAFLQLHNGTVVHVPIAIVKPP